MNSNAASFKVGSPITATSANNSGFTCFDSMRQLEPPRERARGPPFGPKGREVERQSEGELTEQPDLAVAAMIEAADGAVGGADEAVVGAVVLVDEREIQRRHR